MTNRTAHKLDSKWRSDDIKLQESVDFSGLLLSECVLEGLTSAGFVTPSPIQLQAIPLGRCGLDLIVQAKSGTGKTCVFAVIALESILIESNATQVLVLAPTREIAVQICEVVRSVGSSFSGLECHMFIGGLPVSGDKVKLKKCHIAVGTPGRIKQLIEEGFLKTQSIRLFVLDEADKLLEESFQENINWIYSSLPSNKQVLALSATYPEELAQLLTLYMRNPAFARLNADRPALLGITQYWKSTPSHPLQHIAYQHKIDELWKIIGSVTFSQCLVFSNYQTRAQSLCDSLTKKGWPAAYISGSQDQIDRLKTMAEMKNFKCRVLISTDLTARGIDVENVNLVINVDVPWDAETYLHRIGRAGRYGSKGIAITLASVGEESKKLQKIHKQCRLELHPLPDPLPDDLWIYTPPICDTADYESNGCPVYCENDGKTEKLQHETFNHNNEQLVVQNDITESPQNFEKNTDKNGYSESVENSSSKSSNEDPVGCIHIKKNGLCSREDIPTHNEDLNDKNSVTLNDSIKSQENFHCNAANEKDLHLIINTYLASCFSDDSNLSNAEKGREIKTEALVLNNASALKNENESDLCIISGSTIKNSQSDMSSLKQKELINEHQSKAEGQDEKCKLGNNELVTDFSLNETDMLIVNHTEHISSKCEDDTLNNTKINYSDANNLLQHEIYPDFDVNWIFTCRNGNSKGCNTTYEDATKDLNHYLQLEKFNEHLIKNENNGYSETNLQSLSEYLGKNHDFFQVLALRNAPIDQQKIRGNTTSPSSNNKEENTTVSTLVDENEKISKIAVKQSFSSELCDVKYLPDVDSENGTAESNSQELSDNVYDTIDTKHETICNDDSQMVTNIICDCKVTSSISELISVDKECNVMTVQPISSDNKFGQTSMNSAQQKELHNKNAITEIIVSSDHEISDTLKHLNTIDSKICSDVKITSSVSDVITDTAEDSISNIHNSEHITDATYQGEIKLNETESDTSHVQNLNDNTGANGIQNAKLMRKPFTVTDGYYNLAMADREGIFMNKIKYLTKVDPSERYINSDKSTTTDSDDSKSSRLNRSFKTESVKSSEKRNNRPSCNAHVSFKERSKKSSKSSKHSSKASRRGSIKASSLSSNNDQSKSTKLHKQCNSQVLDEDHNKTCTCALHKDKLFEGQQPLCSLHAHQSFPSTVYFDSSGINGHQQKTFHSQERRQEPSHTYYNSFPFYDYWCTSCYQKYYNYYFQNMSCSKHCSSHSCHNSYRLNNCGHGVCCSNCNYYHNYHSLWNHYLNVQSAFVKYTTYVSEMYKFKCLTCKYLQ